MTSQDKLFIKELEAIMLKMPSKDDFEYLRQINEFLSISLRRAILDASEHCRVDGDLFRPHFVAHHVRNYFLKELAQEAETYGFTLHDIGGDSFCLVYQCYTYRFYKSSDGRVPPPRDTDKCMNFYNANGKKWPIQQRFSASGWDFPDAIPSDNISLIGYFDYNIIDGKQQLSWLKIACPRLATRSHVDCFWDMKVELPTYTENFDGFKHSTKEREDLTFSLREDTISSAESDDNVISTELTEVEIKRDDIIYSLRDNEAMLAEAEEDEDTSEELDDGDAAG